MELYQLRAFVTVAEEGNVTRAAERLFSSQPAVSGQIKALESKLGVTLFNRTPAGMTLTEAGEQLVQEARETLGHAQRVEDLARRLRDGTAGTLRVGLNGPAARVRAEVLTRHLLLRCPDLRLHMSSGTTGEILRKLKSYDLDAGFTEGAVPPGVHRLPLPDTHVCIVAPRAWASELSSGDWDALHRRPWVFVSPDCSYFRLFEQLTAEHGLSPQQQFLADEDGTTMQLVRSGLALSLVDRTAADAAAAAGDLFIWPHFAARLPHQAVALKRRLSEPAIAAFFAACSQTFMQTEPRLAAAG